MRELHPGILALDVLAELAEAVEECDHAEIEPPIMQEPAEREVAGAVQLVGGFVSRSALDPGEGTHWDETVA
jgi:hypothetical protein